LIVMVRSLTDFPKDHFRELKQIVQVVQNELDDNFKVYPLIIMNNSIPEPDPILHLPKSTRYKF